METDIQSVNTSTWHYFIKHYWLPILVLIGGFIGIAIWISSIGVTDVRLYTTPAIILFIILGAFYGLAYRKVLKEFMIEFGQSIGFVYSQSADMSSVSGKLFHIGDSAKITNILSGNKDGNAVRIYDFDYTIGSGKNRQVILQTVFEATLKTNVPDIMILGSNTSSAYFLLGDLEKLNLEGDFNKYFTVYSVKNFEMEVYQVLTPDVMADLIDRARDYSVELNAGKLYIFKNGRANTETEMQKLFDLATFFIDLFEKQTRGVNIPQTP